MRLILAEILPILGILSVVGCASPGPRNSSLLKRFEKVELGMKTDQAVRILGEPSRRQSDGDDMRLIYEVPGRIQAIPKVVLWVDRSGSVFAKNIILSREWGDVLSREEFEKKFPSGKFVLEKPAAPKGSHYIPSEMYLVDRNLGLTAELRGDGEVSSIHWSSRKTSQESAITDKLSNGTDNFGP